ncbi:mechanosensitive ion channel family protein [Ornithinibacillus halophilus]|uniref:Mechanosensing system component YbdG n=1 Tax=Ornithinibacillus halophilus TaxID=930117 RepID=A0A1M5J0Y2_9BACI|nr:mechanosensitive ion channel domain-containing protein [Ornithinibacillus halophilus]SHG34237.1 miniconductance mechanosensitive channel [Ornithinibacillus halophilus]
MDFIKEWLSGYNLDSTVVRYLATGIMIAFIAFISILANFITKKIVVRIITHLLTKNKFSWDDTLIKRRVFHKLSHIVPAIIIYSFAPVFSTYQSMIEKGAAVYIIIIGLLVVTSFLDAIQDVYNTYEISKSRPIKGYLQVVKIVLFILGLILVISNLIGESPIMLLGGLGALSAVFMLVFQDSILGLVAGIQLTANDMIRVGDWIEMPKYGADGDVIDISLNTVKVQNWDKTVTMIPAYALISDSFKNWRGMEISGGRRIKRSLYIDTSSISFCSKEKIDQLKQVQYLSDYISDKEHIIEEYNAKNEFSRSNPINGRAMTNIGVFRAYIKNYLLSHPAIHKDMTLMVRQLAPGEYGLPIEIYCFANDTRWEMYENIQADIFDHLFAVAPEFGLRLFQNPSGHDMKSFMGHDEVVREVK